MLAGVGEFTVNLIGDHQQIVVDAYPRNLLQFFVSQRGAGWVAREIQHDRLRARRDRAGDVFGGQREFVIGAGANGFANPVHRAHARVIGHIARLVVEDSRRPG